MTVAADADVGKPPFQQCDPCPFCTSATKRVWPIWLIRANPRHSIVWMQSHCLKCGTTGPWRKNSDDAARDWNQIAKAITNGG